MAINRIEIKDFLVFKDEFSADFCPGVNVIIGGNATGKTTLLKVMYHGYQLLKKGNLHPVEPTTVFFTDKNELGLSFSIIRGEVKGSTGLYHLREKQNKVSITVELFDNDYYVSRSLQNGYIEGQILYIPEKDILEHAKGLLTFIEQKQTGFGKIYKDVLLNAQDIPTQEQSATQQKVGKMIVDTISGTVHWDKGDGSFYTLKPDGNRIPFANEASGYKKLGFLGLLVTSGQLEKGSVLLWDEPENSLNPELVPVLVDILLELQRGGVQIFIATHSEILATYFAINREKGDKVAFYSLYKDKETQQINYDKSDRFDLLTPNNLTAEPVKLYEKELERKFGNG